MDQNLSLTVYTVKVNFTLQEATKAQREYRYNCTLSSTSAQMWVDGRSMTRPGRSIRVLFTLTCTVVAMNCKSEMSVCLTHYLVNCNVYTFYDTRWSQKTTFVRNMLPCFI